MIAVMVVENKFNASFVRVINVFLEQLSSNVEHCYMEVLSCGFEKPSFGGVLPMWELFALFWNIYWTMQDVFCRGSPSNGFIKKLVWACYFHCESCFHCFKVLVELSKTLFYKILHYIDSRKPVLADTSVMKVVRVFSKQLLNNAKHSSAEVLHPVDPYRGHVLASIGEDHHLSTQ